MNCSSSTQDRLAQTQYRLSRCSISRITRLLAVMVLFFTSACLGDTSSGTQPAVTATPYPEAMLTFRVTLPVPLNPGEGLYLNILDEVTGLALNPHGFVMQAEDGTHYSVILPFPIGSVIKYRYVAGHWLWRKRCNRCTGKRRFCTCPTNHTP